MNMVFSYNWLQSFFPRGKFPKPEKLAELLTMHIFEVEEIKKVGNDCAINIDVLPNRAADCFSHTGIAREIAAITGLPLQFKYGKSKESNGKGTKDFVTVAVENKNDCLRYTAKIIGKTKVGKSPSWMQERLQTCGLRPINNIVDAVNYVMLETGQPLHAFDFDKLAKSREAQREKARKIIIRRANRGEKILTLDGEAYELNENILTIADEAGPLVIAGIKGGKKTEVNDKTTTVLLEAANFNPAAIRRGSRLLGLRTDASVRFEHGLDVSFTELAINRAADLIAELASGEAAFGLADVYARKSAQRKIKLEFAYVEKLLGIKLSAGEIKNILKRLGFALERQTAKSAVVLVPAWRLDVLLPEDVAEEIARIYGYEKIPAVFPSVALIPPERNDDIFWEDEARNALKAAGMAETYNYSFISREDARVFGYKTENLMEVANPVSADQAYLRPGLIPNLLRNAEKNQRQFSNIKIFELGKIFRKNADERRVLTGIITGDSFYSGKGIVDALLNAMGIADVWYDEYNPTPEESEAFIWHTQKRAEVKSGKEELGFLGGISNEILKQIGVSGPVTVFDLDFEKIQKLAMEEYVYQPISKYPAAVRDLAVLVPQNTKSEAVLNIIETIGGGLVRDTDLFDIYEGEELPEGKKNLAFRIVYQAHDHTLTSSEIDSIQNKIIAALEENVEWEVRK